VGFVAALDRAATHRPVDLALRALARLEHRGALGPDGVTGDGAGLLTAIPWALLQGEPASIGAAAAPAKRRALGMVFLPLHESKRRLARQLVERMLVDEGLTVAGWRPVPVREDVLGPLAAGHRPHIEQVVVLSPELAGESLERRLLLCRRRIGAALQAQAVVRRFDDLYVCSLSSRTVVYKGMLSATGLADFYPDLSDPAFSSPFAVFHRRFSTNSLPKWSLAQPMRLLAHNGEINTVRGNLSWMAARDADLAHPVWGARVRDLLPTVHAEGSDSGSLDKVVELLVRSGRDPLEALMMVVPEACENGHHADGRPELRDFYEYHAGVLEAWDGPAMIAFGDGRTVGACVDRNGLRPARFLLSHSGLAVVASEAGLLPEITPDDVARTGRLGPGQMLALDLERGKLLEDDQIKRRVAARHPYGRWLRDERLGLPRSGAAPAPPGGAGLLRRQTAFGYTSEDVDLVLRPMALHGHEPVFSMGDDIPLAVLSDKPHTLYDYFKQRFAQVTNPPIDPLRERNVMSLATYLGPRRNLLETAAEHARLVKLESPLLDEAELAGLDHSGLRVSRLSILFPVATGPWGLRDAVRHLCREAESAVRDGADVVVLSDRLSEIGDDAAIPALLAVGAVHQQLLRAGLRARASLVVDAGQCWSVHHIACLVAYGAAAVCPYLALATARRLGIVSEERSERASQRAPVVGPAEAVANYRAAVRDGLLKILSKAGISLLASYHGAQLYEAIGLGDDICALAFAGTPSRIGGLSLEELAQETIWTHQLAFPELTVERLANYGYVRSRRGGEYHVNTPELAKALRRAVVDDDPGGYEAYRRMLSGRPATALRDLFDLRSGGAPLDLPAVESAERIVRRFCTGGMSLGALSPEAHTTLAIAMNRLNARANSGEGGEDARRYRPIEQIGPDGSTPGLPGLRGLRVGDDPATAIKQIASGRFGVTSDYLVHARQIEIKVAQGAKPGEGGQLPGDKVTPLIARLRRAAPGTTLISPPPHHDIYSIEDLAQLILDVRRVNPDASVCVKLAAGPGVGTVAVGVVKAGADVVHVAGHSGGTAAAPLSSIKHAGLPWELGLSEAHRALVAARLRDRVSLRVDGDLRTGHDVVVAAALGADEFAFGSVALMAMGCVMARVCHTNDCPAGVATQRDDLRWRFTARPEEVVRLFRFIAEETRSLLAALGYPSLGALVGRSEALEPKRDLRLAKTAGIRYEWAGIENGGPAGAARKPDEMSPRTTSRVGRPAPPADPPDPGRDDLDALLLQDAEVVAALTTHGTVHRSLAIVTTQRSVGARLAGELARRHGDQGFDGRLAFDYRGAAGQSFAAFITRGMELTLRGEANDYVGKGMAGGTVVLLPAESATFDPAQNLIAGNTCLYGATGGRLFAHGRVGERFAVRNSGARTVVEGAGDHCCEYMTAGVVVVLGSTGRNACAGMTGGKAFFCDDDDTFAWRVNTETTTLRAVHGADGDELHELVVAHPERTGSERAATVLGDWAEWSAAFRLVVPRDRPA
jgi:glutamate synthase (ferredoxin)